MRVRLTITLALAVVLVSCGEDEGYFSTIATSTPLDSTVTTAAAGPSSTTTEAETTTTWAMETTTAPATVTAWAWSRLSDGAAAVTGSDDQATLAVAAYEGGVVVVGSEWMGDEFDAAVWASPDGLTWSRVPHDEAVFGGLDYQRMFGVTAGGPGLVAVGIDGSGGDWDAAVWTSPDGLTWSRVSHDEAVFGGSDRQGMTVVVAGGPGLVAAGYDQSGGDVDGAVWVSSDGLAWSRAAHDEAVLGGEGDQEITAMATVWAGLVAVGYDGTDEDWNAAVWTSVDGEAWRRVPDGENALGGAGDQWISALAAGGPGLVAVGTDYSDGDGKPAVWTSSDGLSWSRVPHDEAAFGGVGDQAIAAVAAGGGGLVAVGRDESGGDVDGAVWTSPDGLAWSRVPHDETVFGGSLDQRMWGVAAGGPGLVVIGEYDTGGDRDGAIWVAVPAG